MDWLPLLNAPKAIKSLALGYRDEGGILGWRSLPAGGCEVNFTAHGIVTFSAEQVRRRARIIDHAETEGRGHQIVRVPAGPLFPGDDREDYGTVERCLTCAGEEEGDEMDTLAFATSADYSFATLARKLLSQRSFDDLTRAYGIEEAEEVREKIKAKAQEFALKLVLELEENDPLYRGLSAYAALLVVAARNQRGPSNTDQP